MAPQPRFYFAYGSNLSLAQMASRCPTSGYHSFALLRNYKWIIGERGYANVSKIEPTTAVAAEGERGVENHVVYGMLYTLQESDERSLDRAEGVPYEYEKQILQVELLSSDGSGKKEENEKEVDALVYVDVARPGEGICRDEYVRRMNRGIEDAVGKGMEKWYVEKYIRPFVLARKVIYEEIQDPFHPEGSGSS